MSGREKSRRGGGGGPRGNVGARRRAALPLYKPPLYKPPRTQVVRSARLRAEAGNAPGHLQCSSQEQFAGDVDAFLLHLKKLHPKNAACVVHVHDAPQRACRAAALAHPLHVGPRRTTPSGRAPWRAARVRLVQGEGRGVSD